MSHILQLSSDNQYIVHYSPSKETLTVAKVPSNASISNLSLSESVSMKTSHIKSLSIHPSQDIIIAVPNKPYGQQSSGIPTGPSSSNSKILKNDINNIDKPIPFNPQRQISLTLYSYNKREISSKQLILDLINESTPSLFPYCVEYSSNGEYLAVYTRSYSHLTGYSHVLFLFDSNYNCLTSISLDSSLEVMKWSGGFILCACTDGKLRVIKIINDDDDGVSLVLIKSLHLSSSPLSSIDYKETLEEKPILLIGTRDGNSILMDPISMSCSYSPLIEKDFPVLSVSIGPLSTFIITYVTNTNEPAHILQYNEIEPIENREVEKIEDESNFNPINDVYQISDIFTNSSIYNPSGVCCTDNGIVIYLDKDGDKIILKNLLSLLPSKSSEIDFTKYFDGIVVNDNSKTNSEIIESKSNNLKNNSKDNYYSNRDHGSSNSVNRNNNRNNYNNSNSNNNNKNKNNTNNNSSNTNNIKNKNNTVNNNYNNKNNNNNRNHSNNTSSNNSRTNSTKNNTNKNDLNNKRPLDLFETDRQHSDRKRHETFEQWSKNRENNQNKNDRGYQNNYRDNRKNYYRN